MSFFYDRFRASVCRNKSLNQNTLLPAWSNIYIKERKQWVSTSFEIDRAIISHLSYKDGTAYHVHPPLRFGKPVTFWTLPEKLTTTKIRFWHFVFGSSSFKVVGLSCCITKSSAYRFRFVLCFESSRGLPSQQANYSYSFSQRPSILLRFLLFLPQTCFQEARQGGDAPSSHQEVSLHPEAGVIWAGCLSSVGTDLIN